MNNKLCQGCGETKAWDAFWFDARRQIPRTRCKACEIKRQRQLPNEVKRFYSQGWRDRHPDKALAKHRRQRATRIDTYRADSSKAKSRRALRTALAKGRIAKPQDCQSCGQVAKLSAHHHDYTKPLEVRWLCLRCHGREHRKPAQRAEALLRTLNLWRDEPPAP